MSIQYHYDPDRHLVYAEVVGVLVMDELRDYANAILADEKIPFGYIQVVDTERMADLDISVRKATEMLSIFKRLIAEKGYWIAVIHTPKTSLFWQVNLIATVFSRKVEIIPVRTLEAVDLAVDKVRKRNGS